MPAGRVLARPLRQALRRLHLNLAHPSPGDLQRFIRLGGGKKELCEAAGWLRCNACRHKQRPQIPRSCNIPSVDLQFGDHLKIDAVMLYDSLGKGHWFLSIVDKCTMFHQVHLLPSHSPEHLFEGLKRGWFAWAGVPREIRFSSVALSNLLSKQGIELRSIAGQAHFQAGKVERQNQIVKDMVAGTVKHAGVRGEEMEDAVIREHGFAPVTLVFGREARCPGEVFEDGAPASFHFSVAERDKVEFSKHQMRGMLSRTLHNRTRVCLSPQPGDRVFFWRERRVRIGRVVRRLLIGSDRPEW